MSKKTSIILVFLFCINYAFTQNNKRNYSLKFQYNPSITFFEASDFGDINFGYKSYGLKKDRLGSMYSLELEKKISNSSFLNISFSTYNYSKKYSEIQFYNNAGFKVDSRLRHISYFYGVTYLKDIKLTNKSNLLVGLGLNILSERNQYFEVSPNRYFYNLYEYKSEEIGANLNLRYEFNLKNNSRIGFESKVFHQLTIFELSDISFGPYFKLEL